MTRGNAPRDTRGQKINHARKMANMTYSEIHESCNKIPIDKVYWKSVVLPSVLVGASVVCWTKSELDQRIVTGIEKL